MKKYVDFDGVIFDTEKLLFDENYYKAMLKKDFDKVRYLQSINWYNLIKNSKEINDSLSILRELREVIILTKINSLDNEGIAKIRILRELDIKNDIILVPFNLKKTDVVDAKNNILVDDAVYNLDDWSKDGGRPIFFNKDNKDIDEWGVVNTKYKKIKSLDCLNIL